MVLLPCGKCCEGSCNVREDASGGEGTTVNVYQFPLASHCVRLSYDALGIPDQFVVSIDGTTVLDTGSVSGADVRCFNKPEGQTDVTVTVIGPEGTEWFYSIGCDDCPIVQLNCCEDIVTCGDIVIRRCANFEEIPPCSDQTTAGEQGCGEQSSCQQTGVAPADNAPYDCLNNAYQGGVWITIQGWNSFPGDRSIFTAAEQEVLDWLDANVNGTFWVPFTCLAKRTSYNLPDLFKETGSCTGLWERFVSVDMCNRTASFNFNYYSSCSPFDTISLSIDVGPKPQSEIPCNDFLGCSCGGFSDNPVWPVGEGANGQISVGVE